METDPTSHNETPKDAVEDILGQMSEYDPRQLAEAADVVVEYGDAMQLSKFYDYLTDRRDHTSPYSGELEWFMLGQALGKVSGAIARHSSAN